VLPLLSDDELKAIGLEVETEVANSGALFEDGWVPQVGDIVRIRRGREGRSCPYGGVYREQYMDNESDVLEVQVMDDGRTRVTCGGLGLHHNDADDLELVRRPS
tara:strand:- start:246 stop:557 length:312 start_codon:yes stop_codon:yes gene_type:complete